MRVVVEKNDGSEEKEAHDGGDVESVESEFDDRNSGGDRFHLGGSCRPQLRT